MPSREQTIQDAVRIFGNAKYPSSLSARTAWLGIYQTLLWYEPVNWAGFGDLPHIIDADKLRPSTESKARAWTGPRAWQRRANELSLHLAEQLDEPVTALPNRTDLLMKQPDYRGMQRQNTLGIAFPGLVRHVLELYGSRSIRYEIEPEGTRIFPGITFPGRSGAPRIDLLATIDAIPRAVISAKWSVRHDRVNDITNECPVYKAAFERIFRQSHASDSLSYFVVTNEYDPSRLSKMLGDSCVDAVIHVHKEAVVEVCGLDGRVNRMIDLADFVSSTNGW